MSVKYLLAGGVALAAILPLGAVAQGWSGMTAAPAFDPAAPQTAPAAPAQPFVLAPAAPAAPAVQPGAPAQPFVLAPAAPAGAAAAAAPEKPAIDESALRYYASKNDVARVAAEIRRLRALHPDWQPPEDLFTASNRVDVDLAPLWALFSAGRYDEMRIALEQLKATKPGFVPPAELVTKLDEAQATAYLVQASDNGDHPRVVAIARNFPGLLVCERIDVLWRVAEALAKTGEPERAYGAYDYVLASCPGAPERLATVQKASELLPEAALRNLLARGQIRFDGTNEFEPVLLDFARRRIGEAIGRADVASAEPGDLARIGSEAKMKKSIGDATLLGWYHYAKKDFAGAETWFRTALGFGDDAKATEGLILAVRNKGDTAAAEAMAYDNRAKAPEIAKVYVEIVSATLTDTVTEDYPAARFAAFQTVVDELKSPLGAQSAGWYLFNRGEFKVAAPWFEKSVAWEETGEGVLGLVLTAQRLGDKKRFASLVETYAPKYAAVEALRTSNATAQVAAGDGTVKVAVNRKKSGGGSLAREAVALYEGKRYREAIAVLDKLKASGRETTDLAVLRGWAYYNTRDYRKAKETFENANARKSTGDTRTGLYYSSQKLRAPHFQ
ncbi:tetratricopeptide repeat protein [Chthonobacter rhizosphaerae]|uniref:tetratricopeptide repeat protein n=1 Tax=Chthonobacter rhizosphaerae TaxID=2735553 RepID=UPI0015EF134E|nr:tetratricopeptide repeat protein [Chthonobacter rhizosphaerae]